MPKAKFTNSSIVLTLEFGTRKPLNFLANASFFLSAEEVDSGLEVIKEQCYTCQAPTRQRLGLI